MVQTIITYGAFTLNDVAIDFISITYLILHFGGNIINMSLNHFWISLVNSELMIQIGSLYYWSSILMLSEWKKLEESVCRAF
jgi:hypothetical protein